MKFFKPVSIGQIAAQIGAKLVGGAPDWLVTGINVIHKVEKGDIMFVDVKKYFQKAFKSNASFIIINDENVECPEGKVLLIHPNPFEAYNQLVIGERPFVPLTTTISPLAKIHKTAIIEPNVVIGPNVVVGKGSYIQANVVLHDCVIIGKNVQIGAGSIIGTDAFFFQKKEGKYSKWRSGGRVLIEDNCDIGTGCTINLGVSGDTIIGEGSKLDAQCHIGHGVVLGKNCLLAAQVGIAGKTILGDNVILYGQVGVAQALTIGSNAVVLAKSGVSKSLEGDKTYFGAPAQEIRDAYREMATLRILAKKDKSED
ncbi:MAG: hypothetical protein RL757_82 [Bacteroidota bacterium]|jgi:UDP-3-O-[3-hydroxymyristoyl] glucosamine N-acyltransferase